MVDQVIRKARERSRKIIEKYHYDGTFDAYTYGKTVDPDTHITRMGEKRVLTEQPCHVSYGSSAAADQTVSAAAISQTVTLLCSPDITITAGTKVITKQAGKTTTYKCSGEPEVYDTHQEITLELFDGWA